MANVRETTSYLEYECHDCGELYAPGVDISRCANASHYVGRLVDCAVPIAKE
jgi:hypothetical protein